MYPQQELSHSVSVEFVKLYLRGSIQQYRGAHRLVPTFTVIADRVVKDSEKIYPPFPRRLEPASTLLFIKVYKNLAKFFWQL
jgi:hypothetical protein